MAIFRPFSPAVSGDMWRPARHWLAALRGELPTAPRNASPSTSPLEASAERAFEQFFRRFEPQITGYLWRMTYDVEASHDLCQETFVRAWQHFRELQAYEQPKAWLLKVATNLALNHKRRREILSLEDHDIAISDPSIRIIERELIHQALMSLPPKQRALLILREVNHVTYTDIAILFEMTPEAVRMALSRAREQFRQNYRRKDPVE